MFRCEGAHVVTHVEQPESWFVSQRLVCENGHSYIVYCGGEEFCDAMMSLNHAIGNREEAMCSKCWVPEYDTSENELDTDTGTESYASSVDV